MKAKKLYYMDCHIAGRKYHDCDEVFNELKVGTELLLIFDENNAYDHNAVAILYVRPRELRKPGYNDEEDNTFLLGYIPRDQNGEISQFLQMGWFRAFECRINKIDPEADPEQQIHVTIRIRPNANM